MLRAEAFLARSRYSDHAEEALLDQRAFFLEPRAHDAFLALLDVPTKPGARLKALMKRKPAWEV